MSGVYKVLQQCGNIHSLFQAAVRMNVLECLYLICTYHSFGERKKKRRAPCLRKNGFRTKFPSGRATDDYEVTTILGKLTWVLGSCPVITDMNQVEEFMTLSIIQDFLFYSVNWLESQPKAVYT